MIKYSMSGFTLLEMIVVLVLFGVLTALVMPGVEKMYNATVISVSRNDLKSVLNQLPLIAKANGTALVISEYPSEKSKLPEQLESVLSIRRITVTLNPPLKVSALGFCAESSAVTVRLEGLSYQLNTSVPACQVIE